MENVAYKGRRKKAFEKGSRQNRKKKHDKNIKRRWRYKLSAKAQDKD